MSYATRYAALKRQEMDRRASTPEAAADRARAAAIRHEARRLRDLAWPNGMPSHPSSVIRWDADREAIEGVLMHEEWPDVYPEPPADATRLVGTLLSIEWEG